METSRDWDTVTGERAIYQGDVPICEVCDMKEKEHKSRKKIAGLIAAIFVVTLPCWSVMGIRHGADAYAGKRSVVISDCIVKSVVEAPGEVLLVVEFPMVQDNLVIGGQMHIVRAYGKWETNKHKVAAGDTVTCAFPERDTRNKGFVVWQDS